MEFDFTSHHTFSPGAVLEENLPEDPSTKEKSDIGTESKPKKDIFRPYCLKDPDIKPFKFPHNYKVSRTN